MIKDKFLREAVQTGEIEEIRRALGMYIYMDPADRRNELRHAIEELENQGYKIFEEHREFAPIQNNDEWDETYLAYLKTDLMENFSKKRLELLLQVGQYVYGNEIDWSEKNTKIKDENCVKSEDGGERKTHLKRFKLKNIIYFLTLVIQHLKQKIKK